MDISEEELDVMRKIDILHTDRPFLGSRRISATLLSEYGLVVNRKRAQRLMRLMGIKAIYPKPKTTIKGKGHKVYPYLLRNLAIDKPNQVWATDITFIPMKKGFLYVVAIIDWFSRKVLSWRISNIMDTSFCIDALEEAISKYGKPEIFNSDQGAQFTSNEFTSKLIANNIQISMDGKGCWVDNVFVERLWRSLKYEEVYLKAYESMLDAKKNIKIWIDYYNQKRPHLSMEKQTPNDVYYAKTPLEKDIA